MGVTALHYASSRAARFYGLVSRVPLLLHTRGDGPVAMAAA